MYLLRSCLIVDVQTAVQQRALRVLKQKRMYENQLAQLTQQTFNMESAALTTENLRNTMATVEAMKVANKELRKQYGKIDIDKIEVNITSPLGSRMSG
jgi:charged multivesicular body protein 5